MEGTDAPRLPAERLTLRRLRPDDAANLFRTVGDPDVMRYWAPGPDPTIEAAAQRIAEIEAHWAAHGFGDWGVVERATGALIGFAGLHHIAGMPEVNVGYALEETRWGRGYATEAAAAVLAYAFDVLGLNRVHATHLTRNPASGRVMEKVGMTHEGRSRGHFKKWGVFEDVERYGILRREYRRADSE